tara:strand:+ start:1184 stop:1369 length:186 start_codon:yes stop_codon:yes gene_type:complete
MLYLRILVKKLNKINQDKTLLIQDQHSKLKKKAIIGIRNHRRILKKMINKEIARMAGGKIR